MLKEKIVVPAEEYWRLPYLRSLLGQKRTARDLAMDEVEGYLSELIDSLVKN